MTGGDNGKYGAVRGHNNRGRMTMTYLVTKSNDGHEQRFDPGPFPVVYEG